MSAKSLYYELLLMARKRQNCGYDDKYQISETIPACREYLSVQRGHQAKVSAYTTKLPIALAYSHRYYAYPSLVPAPVRRTRSGYQGSCSSTADESIQIRRHSS